MQQSSIKALFSTGSLDELASIFPSAVVFAVDGDRKLSYWSKGAEAILGFHAKDLIGQNCLTGNRCQECISGCDISKHGQIDAFPITLHHREGHSINFRKYARAYFDEHGNFDGGVEVLIPIERNVDDRLGQSHDPQHVFHGIVSSDPAMQEIFKLVINVAETDVNVLVRGESGSGKELIAMAIHNESPRKEKPFMALNCAALSSNLLESELFGHVKGAFTDAVRDHIGVIQRAEGGTLFLDEVAELPLELQAKLLRVLQEREFTPLGSEKVIKADIRILAATHQSLRMRVHEGKFREDLMYRLRVVPLFLPPLRDRKGDVNLLLNYFMQEFEKKGFRKVKEIHPDAMRLLLNYPWPGNVRELRNIVEYANAVSRSDIMTVKDLPPEFLESKTLNKNDKINNKDELEIRNIKRALQESDGNLDLTAELLGISRTTLWRKRKKYQI